MEGSSREGREIIGSFLSLSLSLGVRPRSQSYGALHVCRGRGRAQGEEEDPICCSRLCPHQPGPSASGDGELTVQRLLFDPSGQIATRIQFLTRSVCFKAEFLTPVSHIVFQGIGVHCLYSAVSLLLSFTASAFLNSKEVFHTVLKAKAVSVAVL